MSGSGYGDGGNTDFRIVSVGVHTVAELAHGTTDLSRYTTSISCSNGDAGTGTSLTLSALYYGQAVTCTIRNVVASLVTSSSLCTFDTDNNTPGNQFRLLFTPDGSPNSYKQNASNPGQYHLQRVYWAPADTSAVEPVYALSEHSVSVRHTRRSGCSHLRW